MLAIKYIIDSIALAYLDWPDLVHIKFLQRLSNMPFRQVSLIRRENCGLLQTELANFF